MNDSSRLPRASVHPWRCSPFRLRPRLVYGVRVVLDQPGILREVEVPVYASHKSSIADRVGTESINRFRCAGWF